MISILNVQAVLRQSPSPFAGTARNIQNLSLTLQPLLHQSKLWQDREQYAPHAREDCLHNV